MIQARKHELAAWALLFCLTVPWINPFAPGPSASIGPWLFSAAMASLFVVLFTLAPANLRNGPHLANLASRAWLAAALISAAIALIQYFGWAPHFQGAISQPYQHGQVFGNLRQRNQLASLMAIGLAALWLRKPGVPNLGCVALFALIAGITTSRAGLLEMIVLLVMAAFWARGRSRAVMPTAWVAAAGYVAGVLVLPMLLEWFSGERPEGLFERTLHAHCGSRGHLWSNVVDLIAQRPWTGWGWGELDYAHYQATYSGPRFCDILDNAHNLPLHLAVELGIPAALAACSAAAWAVVKLAPWRETNPIRQMAWMVITAIAIHSMVEYPLWYGPFQMAMALSAALLWMTRTGHAEPATQLRLRASAVVAVLALMVTGYAAWDYGRVSQLYLQRDQRRADLRDDTLVKVGNSILFADQVRFARLSTAPRTLDEAPDNLVLARRMLHFSPEPIVVEMEIESLLVMGLNKEAIDRMSHYGYVFPAEYAAWQARMGIRSAATPR